MILADVRQSDGKLRTRTFELKAHSEAERERWVDGLKELREQFQQATPFNWESVPRIKKSIAETVGTGDAEVAYFRYHSAKVLEGSQLPPYELDLMAPETTNAPFQVTGLEVPRTLDIFVCCPFLSSRPVHELKVKGMIASDVQPL